MPDTPELIEQFELDLDSLIYKAHRTELPFTKILWCILHWLENMVAQCTAEGWFTSASPTKPKKAPE